jgi:hypothetical protein
MRSGGFCGRTCDCQRFPRFRVGQVPKKAAIPGRRESEETGAGGAVALVLVCSRGLFRILACLKQGHDLLSPRSDPCKIRALMQIRAVARQCEIIWIIGAAVLSRDDVLNMMDQSAMFLLQPAVFATLASPPPNEVPRRRIHLPLNV